MFLLCLFFVLSVTSGKNIRPMDNTRLKIINGQTLDIRYRPFMVSIHFGNTFICGGTIVSEFWVLTAKHCIYSDQREVVKRYYNVRAGSTYFYKGYIYRISKVSILNSDNKLAKSEIPRNDVGLVKITPKFRFSATIRPAKLPDASDRIPDILWVSGWGLTENHELSRKLRFAAVKKVPFDVCFNISIYAGLIIDGQHLCFGGEGYDSCQGDSGGPLADQTTVYGIASFGANECGVLPGVYESVSYYSDWIEYTIYT